MKNVLILGKNSYIGKALAAWLQRTPDEFAVEMLSQRDDRWKAVDFGRFDVVVDCVGVAHRKDADVPESDYLRVNAELAFEAAKKAKDAGVRQFIFLSSMSVFGALNGKIDRETPPAPDTKYGKSKVKAEELLAELADDTFAIAVLRPPMVYGEGCKGNYQALVRLAQKLPVVPTYRNQRSLISIENLCRYIQTCIEKGSRGLFLPQDPVYHSTCDMIAEIAEGMGRAPKRSALLNPGVWVLKTFTKVGRKAFRDLIYLEFSGEE